MNFDYLTAEFFANYWLSLVVGFIFVTIWICGFMPRVGVIVSWINSLSRRLEEATENLDELKDKVEELNERFEKLDDEVYGIKNNRKRTFCDE